MSHMLPSAHFVPLSCLAVALTAGNCHSVHLSYVLRCSRAARTNDSNMRAAERETERERTALFFQGTTTASIQLSKNPGCNS